MSLTYNFDVDVPNLDNKLYGDYIACVLMKIKLVFQENNEQLRKDLRCNIFKPYFIGIYCSGLKRKNLIIIKNVSDNTSII